MKTTLIQIDPHDDLISIKDKMTWVKSQRLLLFFPNGYPLDQSSLTMKLIRRYAEANGNRIALITKNQVMREIAQEQDIPCFETAPQAEKKPWPQPKQMLAIRTLQGLEKIVEKKEQVSNAPKSRKDLNIQKIITNIILAVFLTAGFIVTIPSAVITIYPKTYQQEIEFTVVADPDAKSLTLDGTIPAEKITVSVDDELAGDSTGKVVTPKSKATGVIELINLSDKTLVLPRGTIVSTDGNSPVEFYITTDVSLPASTSAVENIPIEAVTAGESGNVDSKFITRINGLEQLLSVSNSKPTSGGTEQSFSTPSEADYQKLENLLRAQLISKCKEQFSVEVGEITTLVENSVEIDSILNRVETPKIGEPSDRAILSLEVSCSVLVVNQLDEKQLAQRLLDQEIPENQVPMDDQIIVTNDSMISLNSKGMYSWNVLAVRSLMVNWNKDNFLKSISGKKIPTATEMIAAAFQQTKYANITVNPRWWKRMPILPGRITIVLGSQ